MTKALMGLENLSYGMENSAASHWPGDVSCNTKMVVDNLKMAVLPQTHSTIPSPATPKTCQQVVDLTDDDLLQATTPIEESQTNGAISQNSGLNCSHCPESFEELNDLEAHVEVCPMRPPPLLRVPSPIECKSEEPPDISPNPSCSKRWCQKPIHPDDQPRYPMDKYVQFLHLAPKGKDGELEEEVKPHHDVECMDLDLDEDMPQATAPPTPRSAKRLLSQLSRDFSPPPVKSPRLKSPTEEGTCEKDENKDNVVVGDLDLDPDYYVDSDSDCNAEKIDGKYAVKVRSSASLLTIDFASPLGQRIKDKYNYKIPKPVPNEDEDSYEQFCHTPKKTRSFMDRLRNREKENDGFPITFNRRKRVPDHRSHWIKFTRKDREEFKMVLKTGLTARARKLQKKLKPFSVKLKRISEEDIKKWRRKPNPFQRWPYQRALDKMYPLANYPHPVPAILQNAQMQQRMLIQQQRQLQLQRSGLVAPQWATAGGIPVHLAKNMFAPQMNGMLNGRLNKVKRQSSTGDNSNDSDLICISSDEEDNADVKVTASSRAPSQDAQRRASQTGIIRFKCHLCAAEINGQLGSTDFIAEHFGKRHDVHNIRLHQSVDVNGQTVVTIVQDIPKSTNNNGVHANAQSRVPPQRSNSVNRPAPSGDDEIICLD